MIYQFFPRTAQPEDALLNVYNCFEDVEDIINSTKQSEESNWVLSKVSAGLEDLEFRVEKSKKDSDKIIVPVLFGKNGSIDKRFDADALSGDGRIVVEVEAGRAYTNNQFLKDIFQASVMQGVEYLVLAVRETYRDKQKDFDQIYKFIDTLYSSERLKLPLKGILLVGY